MRSEWALWLEAVLQLDSRTVKAEIWDDAAAGKGVVPVDRPYRGVGLEQNDVFPQTYAKVCAARLVGNVAHVDDGDKPAGAGSGDGVHDPETTEDSPTRFHSHRSPVLSWESAKRKWAWREGKLLRIADCRGSLEAQAWVE